MTKDMFGRGLNTTFDFRANMATRSGGRKVAKPVKN